MRCEHRTNPLGIGVTTPDLSWIVSAEDVGARQTAYQLIASSSAERVKAGVGDLWDTGKVSDSESINHTYDGDSLTPNQKVYWAVRLWDEQDLPGNWSDPAEFSIGLLDESEWQAEWIGYDALRNRELEPAQFGKAQWIAHAGDDPMQTPVGNRVFLFNIDVPEGATVVEAEAIVGADDKHWLAVNGNMIVHGEEGWKVIKPVGLREALSPGRNEVRINVENTSVGTSALIGRVVVKLDTGERMTYSSSPEWLSHASPGHHWASETIVPEALTPSKVVAAYTEEPWGESSVQQLFLPPVPRLRGAFKLGKPVDSATLYITALGICDAYLNGQRVTEEFFTPGWPDYRKRVYYRTYDVTGQITQGENVLGAELADGWYSGYIGWGRNRDHYGKAPRVRMQMHVRYADGSEEIVGTNSLWKATEGPTVEADFLMGESTDRRREISSWCESNADLSNWSSVVVGADPPAVLEPHPGPPVVAVGEFTPVSVSEPKPGVYVYDMGRNFAGVVRMIVDGTPGQRVQLRYAERLKEDGTLYTINLRGARTVDNFICSGGRETWTPRFTFHGFQYVEVTGTDKPLPVEDLTGIALSSDTPLVGKFESSDPMLNQLVSNTLWTQRANFIDVPTDCPQRDERLGWTGDAQVYVGAACLHTDAQAFFDKWLVDLNDGQREDGQYPMVAPLVVAGDDGGPAWADAGVICPWSIYETYGDKKLLKRSYPSMKRFVEFTRQRSLDEVLPPKDYHCFGDWLSVNADTPTDVIYTAYYGHSTRLLAKTAEVLGYESDARGYHELADRIADAFQREYVDDTGVVRGDTQCGYVLALAYDLLPEPKRTMAAEHLVKDIEERGDHLSTGFVGTKDLMLVLAKIGRNDVAYRLLHQESYPSWGFSIKQGATSIWERWDGWTPDRGFQDPGMNSFAHYSFGAVYQWMVENIGGIKNGGDAYRKVIISPTVDDRLEWVDVGYNSVRGPIRSSWKKTANGLEHHVAIPANCEATLVLHETDHNRVVVSPVTPDTKISQSDSGAEVLLPSGNYSISVRK